MEFVVSAASAVPNKPEEAEAALVMARTAALSRAIPVFFIKNPIPFLVIKFI